MITMATPTNTTQTTNKLKQARTVQKDLTMNSEIEITDLCYMTPDRHHIVVHSQVALISVTHVSNGEDYFVINKTHKVSKSSCEKRGVYEHFVWLANFCNMQDN